MISNASSGGPLGDDMPPEETYGILLAPGATVVPSFKTVCLHPVIAARQAEGVANIVNGIYVATKNFL